MARLSWAPVLFSSAAIAIIASKAVHLITHVTTVPLAPFVLYLPTVLIFDLLAILVLRLLLQPTVRGGLSLAGAVLGGIFSVLIVGGSASEIGFFLTTGGELDWRDAQAYANAEAIVVLVSGGSVAVASCAVAIYVAGFLLRKVIYNAVGNVVWSLVGCIRRLISFRPWRKTRRYDGLGIANANGRKDDVDDVRFIDDEAVYPPDSPSSSDGDDDPISHPFLPRLFDEERWTPRRPTRRLARGPRRPPPRLIRTVGLIVASLYLTIASIKRPERPYRYLSDPLPIAMLAALTSSSSDRDYCEEQTSIWDNPWPFPDQIGEDQWEAPDPANGFKGWAPGPNSTLAADYRQQMPTWLPPKPPRGFFRWDPQRFVRGFLGSHTPPGPQTRPYCKGLADKEEPFYNPINDPLKISNLDKDILKPLSGALGGGSVRIKNVVLIFMESLRQDLWPLQQGSRVWKNIMDAHITEYEARQDEINYLLSEIGPNAEKISGVRGNFHDASGKPYPKTATNWDDSGGKDGFGGINVVGTYSASTMSTKSWAAAHCGAWPMPVERFDEADTDSYQPCIPQILEIFNRVKGNDTSTSRADEDDFRGQQWVPALFESQLENYDGQDFFDRKIGFGSQNVFTRPELEAQLNASDFNDPLVRPVNYFAYPERLLKPRIADLLRSSHAKKQRVWISHFTSTTHHPWDVPPDFPVVDYLPHSSASSSWHADFNKFLNTLRYHDGWIGELMQLLQDEGVANETLVVFAGDHGMAFKEDYHKTTTYENPHVSNFRVPITFWHPHLPRVQLKFNSASSISILPTVLDLLVASGSLDSRDVGIAADLVQDYEGQSFLRPHKVASGKRGSTKRRAWNFSVVSMGEGILVVSSADVPYKVAMPLDKKMVEYMVSNPAEDPAERKAVTAWTLEELLDRVAEKQNLGEDAKVWTAEAVAVGRWWAKERKRLWRFRTLPFYPGLEGLVE